MRPTSKYFREKVGGVANALRGLARRLAITLTDASMYWQVRGYQDAEGNTESIADVPVFANIGFMSRPASGGRPEAIMVSIGSAAGHPVIVATRDQRLTATLAEDETIIHNSKSRVIIKANGEVLVDNGSGALALALKSDVDSIKSWLSTHTHSGVTTGPGNSGVSVQAAALPTATGTQTLKAR
jgi:phage gp45-like